MPMPALCLALCLSLAWAYAWHYTRALCTGRPLRSPGHLRVKDHHPADLLHRAYLPGCMFTEQGVAEMKGVQAAVLMGACMRTYAALFR
jgi:hypothetical protein